MHDTPGKEYSLINNRQQSGRRRGRGGQRPQGGGRGPESGNRIDSRARGNAPQMLEKYKTLARDAQQSGDRVLTEYYLQFADHYFRVVAETRARYEENQAPHRQQGEFGGEDQGYEGEEGYEGDEFDPRPQSRPPQPQPQQPQQQPRYQRDDGGNNRDGRDDRGNRDDGNGYRPQPQQRDRYAEDRLNGNAAPRDDRPRDDRPRDDRPREAPPRRERYVRPEVNEVRDEAKLSVDRLPPAFAPTAPAPEVAEDAPPVRRPRGRPRKDAGITAES